jgi:hypothetical protein
MHRFKLPYFLPHTASRQPAHTAERDRGEPDPAAGLEVVVKIFIAGRGR